MSDNQRHEGGPDEPVRPFPDRALIRRLPLRAERTPMPDLSGEGFVDEVELLDAVPASNAVAGTGADAPMVALGSSSGIAPIAPATAPLPAPSPEPEIQPGKHWGWWPMAVVVLLAIAIMIFLAVHVPVISVGAG